MTGLALFMMALCASASPAPEDTELEQLKTEIWAGFKEMMGWECLFSHDKLKLIHSVYVNDFKLAGKKKDLKKGWKIIEETCLELDPPTPLPGRRLVRIVLPKTRTQLFLTMAKFLLIMANFF